MKKLTRYVVSIGFLAAMMLPALSILSPVSVTEIENRAIEEPDVSASRLLDIEFYKETMVYVRDANPIRISLIRLGAGVDLNLFDDSPDPSRVFKGRDDWLFFRQTVTEGCSTPPDLVATNINEFVNALEDEIETVVFTVAPSKFSIHPEKLTNTQLALTECARKNSEDLRNLLEVAPLEHYVNGWDIMESLKAQAVEPYFRTDTHFNYVASIRWMKGLIDEIGPVWDDSAVTDLGMAEFQGNLMSFLGVVEPEPTRKLVVSRLTPSTPTSTQFNGNLRLYDFSENVEFDLIDGETLIIGDSFMDIPEPSLVQFFERVSVADWRHSEAVTWSIDNARRFKTVLIEVSAKDVWSLFDDDQLLRRYLTGSSQ